MRFSPSIIHQLRPSCVRICIICMGNVCFLFDFHFGGLCAISASFGVRFLRMFLVQINSFCFIELFSSRPRKSTCHDLIYFLYESQFNVANMFRCCVLASICMLYDRRKVFPILFALYLPPFVTFVYKYVRTPFFVLTICAIFDRFRFIL